MNRMMNVGLWFLLFPLLANAAGTPTETLINSLTRLDYAVEGSAKNPLYVEVEFSVDELLDVVAVATGVGTTGAVSPSEDNVVTYQLTNVGNGVDAYQLSLDLSLLDDDFDPVNGEIWLESGVQDGLQTSGVSVDQLYIQGSNDPQLDANGSDSIVVYGVADIPAGRIQNDIGKMALVAESTHPGAAGAVPGTAFSSASDGGTSFAVVGTSQATAIAVASYEIQGVNVVVDKTVLSIVDPMGGDLPLGGSVITYQLVVRLEGGAIESMTVSDPIPENTTYVPDSIRVDDVSQTDAADADASDFDVSNGNAVTVNLGDLTGPVNHRIEFQVTIN